MAASVKMVLRSFLLLSLLRIVGVIVALKWIGENGEDANGI